MVTPTPRLHPLACAPTIQHKRLCGHNLRIFYQNEYAPTIQRTGLFCQNIGLFGYDIGRGGDYMARWSPMKCAPVTQHVGLFSQKLRALLSGYICFYNTAYRALLSEYRALLSEYTERGGVI